MEFPITIDSQDAFDGLVKDRLARERAKFADYDEIRTRAEGVEQAIADAVAEVNQKHAEELAKFSDYDELKTTVEKNEQERALTQLKNEVAKEKGVPAEALAGSSKEELERHADVLKPLLTAKGPVIPGQGNTPEPKVIDPGPGTARLAAAFDQKIAGQ